MAQRTPVPSRRQLEYKSILTKQVKKSKVKQKQDKYNLVSMGGIPGKRQRAKTRASRNSKEMPLQVTTDRTSILDQFKIGHPKYQRFDQFFSSLILTSREAYPLPLIQCALPPKQGAVETSDSVDFMPCPSKTRQVEQCL